MLQNNKRTILTIIIFIGTIIFLPNILFFLTNLGQTKCIFNNLFGIQCYGCGMTRAFYSVVTFNIPKALEYNKLVIIAFPLSIYEYFKFVDRIVLKHLKREEVNKNGNRKQA